LGVDELDSEELAVVVDPWANPAAGDGVGPHVLNGVGVVRGDVECLEFVSGPGRIESVELVEGLIGHVLLGCAFAGPAEPGGPVEPGGPAEPGGPDEPGGPVEPGGPDDQERAQDEQDSALCADGYPDVHVDRPVKAGHHAGFGDHEPGETRTQDDQTC